MSKQNGASAPAHNHVDYDIHGLVGIRLLNPAATDEEAVSRQIGPLKKALSREPDIVVRFVDHIPVTGLRHLTLNENGFTDDSFFILRSSKKAARVKVAFEQVGSKQCEIVCETGVRSVPLLLALVNLTMLRKDVVALHASGFVYQDTGIVVTGWAKGGKTETLLSFAAHGGRYVGDEWILLSGDGQKMYGIPEVIRLWDWHIENLPHVRREIKRENLMMFKAIHGLDSFQQNLNGTLGKMLPIKLLREGMPRIKRQLNVRVEPEIVFGDRFGPFSARPDKVFFALSHAEATTTVEPMSPAAIAKHMISSIRFEQIPFMQHYLAFKFAFPERANEFLDNVHELQYEILQRALAGKEAYTVRHPYPVSFQDLYEKMKPYCESKISRRMDSPVSQLVG